MAMSALKGSAAPNLQAWAPATAPLRRDAPATRGALRFDCRRFAPWGAQPKYSSAHVTRASRREVDYSDVQGSPPMAWGQCSSSAACSRPAATWYVRQYRLLPT